MKLDGCMTKSKTVYFAEEDLYLSYHLSSHSGAQGRTEYDLMLESMQGSAYDSCCLLDIAACCEMAQRIFWLFVTEAVTPITAKDILEELLSCEDFLYGEMDA